MDRDRAAFVRAASTGKHKFEHVLRTVHAVTVDAISGYPNLSDVMVIAAEVDHRGPLRTIAAVTGSDGSRVRKQLTIVADPSFAHGTISVTSTRSTASYRLSTYDGTTIKGSPNAFMTSVKREINALVLIGISQIPSFIKRPTIYASAIRSMIYRFYFKYDLTAGKSAFSLRRAYAY